MTAGVVEAYDAHHHLPLTGDFVMTFFVPYIQIVEGLGTRIASKHILNVGRHRCTSSLYGDEPL